MKLRVYKHGDRVALSLSGTEGELEQYRLDDGVFKLRPLLGLGEVQCLIEELQHLKLAISQRRHPGKTPVFELGDHFGNRPPDYE